MNSLRYLFYTSRPISWVNTAYPFAASYFMLGGRVDSRLVVGCIFFLVAYNLIMYGINDVFDYESDILNPRKGGVEGAITPKKYHRLIVISSICFSLPFIVYLMIGASFASNAVLVITLFFVVAYSAKGLRYKEVPILDSVTSSIHFVGPMIYACTFFPFNTTYLLIVAAFFVWGMASHALGAVQDIQPDKEAGIDSIATKFGAKRTVYFSMGLYVMAVLMTLLLSNYYAYIIACCLSLYVFNIFPFLRVTDHTSQQAGVAWKRFLWLNYITGAVITISIVASQYFS